MDDFLGGGVWGGLQALEPLSVSELEEAPGNCILIKPPGDS